MANKIIEIAYMVNPDHTYVMSAKVPESWSVSEILTYVGMTYEGCGVGQLGRKISLDTICAGGTRIDVVDSLLIDPKQSRKKRSLK